MQNRKIQRVRWEDLAACEGVGVEPFTPAVENAKDLGEVRSAFCDHCDVRPECLLSALYRGDIGYWGGMSTVQRKALRAKKTRKHCPACEGKNTAVNLPADGPEKLRDVQLCLACGVSWDAGPHHEPPAVEEPEDRPYAGVCLSTSAPAARRGKKIKTVKIEIEVI